MLLGVALRVTPFLKVYWLIILEHFIISFCLLNHYITTLCCCQVVFLMIMLYKPYQLKHLNFPTYLFTHHAFTEIAIAPRIVQPRLPVPMLTVWNSLPFFLRVNRYIWLNRTWTCNSLAFAKRVPSYAISQYNIRLYSSNHNIYGNGYEDYNIFY